MSSFPGADRGLTTGKPGDWPCPDCKYHNYPSRHTCFRCSTPKPVDLPSSAHRAAPGTCMRFLLQTRTHILFVACSLNHRGRIWSTRVSPSPCSGLRKALMHLSKQPSEGKRGGGRSDLMRLTFEALSAWEVYSTTSCGGATPAKVHTLFALTSHTTPSTWCFS